MNTRREPDTSRTVVMLDSASLDDVEQATVAGLLAGITTNPALLRKEGGDPLEQLCAILATTPVPVFFQPTEADTTAAREQLAEARALDPDRVRAKLPLADVYLPLLREACDDGAPFAVTAVYSPVQALVASEFGAGWIIPYVDRARRLLDDGDTLVSRLRIMLDRIGSPTKILAASIKSPEQAERALLDGADVLTLPAAVLAQLHRHELTDSAVAEFTTPTSG
jgi:transaldolase